MSAEEVILEPQAEEPQVETQPEQTAIATEQVNTSPEQVTDSQPVNEQPVDEIVETVEVTPVATEEPDLAPTPTSAPSATPLWSETGEKTFETGGNLVLNETYASPQNDKLKIVFTRLPEGSGKLTIKEVTLTPEQMALTGALTETAYEITSNMQDGTFEYDLTLPLPPQAENREVEVVAAETKEELPSAPELSEQKEKTIDTITIKGLNHFTVFVITTPNPDTTQRVLINEILPNPTAGAEWIELFNNGTTQMDFAAGAGWTIRNSAGNSQSLSSLGTIAAGGRDVFEAPAGWLSNSAPETVTIINENGTTIDTVTVSLFSPGTAIDHYPLAGESVGRRTDGVADWVIFTTPSKGTANVINVSNGNLAQTGPVGGTTGFPTWYKDGSGIALDLMEAADGNGISAPVEAGNAFSEAIGFGAEGFWWSADATIDTSAGSAILVQAIEAAFAGESAVDGEQSSFARVRIRVDVAEPGTYTVTYPYGQKTYVVTTPGTRAINDTVDIGCFAQPGILDCEQAGAPNFSTLLNGGIGPFLTWSTFNQNPALSDPLLSTGGRRYVGLGTVEHAVTGSPTGNNFFRIQGPNIGGPGVNVIQTNLFAVTGRLSDNSAPTITLFGSNPVTVLQNATYTDAGATAIDTLGGNLTGSIITTGLPVDTATLGAKTVTYTVTDNLGNSASLTRTVNVVETPVTDTTNPVVTVTGANPASVVQGTAYTDSGATALDNVDGDLSAGIITTGLPINTSVLGANTVTYTVTDAAGNTGSATRTVNVVADAVDPVVTVLGSNPINVFIGATYTDAGATALDNVGGNMTASIITTGLPIDTSSAADHTVTYTVTDAAGNVGSATRTVHVAASFAAGLSQTGPLNATSGFPEWYRDSTNLALDLMEAADPNGISAPVEAGNTFSEAIGFGAEGFWWSADADLTTSGPNGAILVQAIEAAFAGESAVDGEQSAFARVRIRIDVGEPGTYTVTFPYGSRTYTVASVGAGFEINDTSDIGCFAQPGILDCSQAGAPNFSTVLSGEIGPYLTWNTFNADPLLSDPLLTNAVTNRRYVGLSTTPHAVTGSPTGDNFFRIEGPNIGGPGVNSVQTSLFTVTGRVVEPVNNTAPVITILGANPASVTQNAVYTDSGATATDPEDGDLTAEIITTGLPIDTATLGAHTVTYTVTDADTNTTEVTRTVNVVAAADTTAPVITRLGASPVTVTVGNAYSDAGATAFDNVDGTITANIVTVNPVNTAVAGTYTVTYNVSDAAGNPAAEVTRTVNVVETAPTTGTITIVKDAVLNHAQDFEYRLRSGAFDQSFFLDDDSDGTLSNNRVFADLTPGEFDLQENGVGGWTVVSISCQDADLGTTVDLNARSATVDLDAGENITCTFTNAPTQAISGMKFSDLDNDGVKDAGEPGLSGWTVFLDTDDDGVLDAGETSTTTASDGSYQFTSVANGTVNVREVTQDNWEQTAPAGGKHTLAMTSNSSFINKDFGNSQVFSVGGMGSFVSNGGASNSTTSVISRGVSTITVTSGGGTSTITIPDGTVITRTDGLPMDISLLTSSMPSVSSISGLGSGVVADGVLQWGIPNIGLSFNPAITLSIFLGTSFNGQTLNLQRSVTGTSGWTSDGIVAPATCVVSAGLCSFQATKASFYAPTHTTSSSNSDSSSSSSNSSSSSSSGSNVCTDSAAGSAPTLLSAVPSGNNEVTLTWTKAADPVTHYSIIYGLQSGNPEFGNTNVGGSETTSFTVRHLSGGRKHFFKVGAVNGCSGGDFSNEISATPGGGPVSGPAEGFTEGAVGGGVLGVTEENEQSDELSENDLSEASILGVGEDKTQGGQSAGSLTDRISDNLNKYLLITLAILVVAFIISIQRRKYNLR